MLAANYLYLLSVFLYRILQIDNGDDRSQSVVYIK